MITAAKTTASSTAPLTRGMTVAAKTTSASVAMGTRGMLVAAKVTSKTVAAYTRRIVEPAPESDAARKLPFGSSDVTADPWGNFRFALFLAGSDGKQKEMGHFQECSGLKNSAEVFEIKEGGLNGRTHKRPGQSKWENITLRYASSASTELLDWRNQFLQDKFTEGLRVDPAKSTGAIVLMDNAGKVLRKYEFKNAWPVSWEGPSLSSGGSALAVEALEIAHEGLTITEGS
jgi:phage tail-like protein